MVSGEHDWLFPYGYYIRLLELTYRTRNVPLAQLRRVSATHQRSHPRTAKASSKLRLPPSGSLIILKCKWHVWCVILSGPFGTPVTFSQRCLLRSQAVPFGFPHTCQRAHTKAVLRQCVHLGDFFVFKEVRKGVKKQGKKGRIAGREASSMRKEMEKGRAEKKAESRNAHGLAWSQVTFQLPWFVCHSLTEPHGLGVAASQNLSYNI